MINGQLSVLAIDRAIIFILEVKTGKNTLMLVDLVNIPEPDSRLFAFL